MRTSCATSAATPSIPRRSDHARAWPARGVPRAAAPRSARAHGADRRRAGHACRFFASAHALPLHRLHAAMGFSRLSRRARRGVIPTFHLRMRAEVTDLIWRRTDRRRRAGEDAGRDAGGARRSRRRRRRPPFDGARPGRPRRSRTSARRWTCCGCGFSRRADDPDGRSGRIEAGRFFVMLDRGDYWQCAFVIPKGGFDELRAPRAAGLSQRRRRARAVRSPTASARSRTGTM